MNALSFARPADSDDLAQDSEMISPTIPTLMSPGA
jgi:hypothetical protein